MLRQVVLKVALAAGVAVIGATLTAISAVYLSIGIYQLLQNDLSPAVAAFLTAVIAIFALLLVFGIAKLVGAVGNSRTKRRAERASASAAEVGSLLGRRLGLFTGRETPGILLISLVIGFLLGVSPRLRSVLIRMLGL